LKAISICSQNKILIIYFWSLEYADHKNQFHFNSRVGYLKSWILDLVLFSVRYSMQLSALLETREALNGMLHDHEHVTVNDMLLKAAGLAMNTVPDVNSSWMETVVRRYSRCDVNLVVVRSSNPPLARLAYLHALLGHYKEKKVDFCIDRINLARAPPPPPPP
jgi:hypothetical protein